MTVIVDASVAVKWFIAEPRSIPALALFDTEFPLAAPEVIRLEVGSALLRAVREKRLAAAEAVDALRRLDSTELAFVSTEAHVLAAYDLASSLGGSIFDCVYIALARAMRGRLVSDDQRMIRTARAAGVPTAALAEGALRFVVHE